MPEARALVLVMVGIAILGLNLDPILSLYGTGFHATLPVTPLFDLWR